ncbi:MAG TPA: CHAT domain-containing protein, partial [Roseiflexaceae bacterium]|nr:CHAT domain-containing protein [Roseiflexaceae bacterium]
RIYEARAKPEWGDRARLLGQPHPDARTEAARVQRAQARRAYQRAVATVESLRDLIGSEDWQVSALQNKLQVFECAMHFFYHADKQRYAARIFELSEQLKGRAFLDLLESTRLNRDVPMARGLREKQEQLDTAYARLTQARRLAGEAELERLAEKEAKLEERRVRLRCAIDDARKELIGDVCPQPLSWRECQSFLKQQPDTILLSFAIGDDNSYLLVGDSNALDVFELPGRAAIEALAAQLLVYLAKDAKYAFEFATINRALVEMLLGPAIRAGLLERLPGKRLVLLPDGILYYLPFEALLVREPVDAHDRPIDFEIYRRLDGNVQERIDSGKQLFRALLPFYLLHEGPISYAHSASIWKNRQTAPPRQAERTALGVYRIRYVEQLPERPGYKHATELNINFEDNLSATSRLAQVLDAFDGDETSILRLSAEPTWPPERQSTEGNFKANVQKKVRYVIFAGHGVYNDKYPQFSGIVFNMPTRRNTREDGFFGLRDLFELDMRETELVFLVACQSALGMISRGEGINALTRAFMYHGSPSVIASLWKVEVDPTMKLVELFFEQLRAQPDADKARLLQQTKQALCARSDKDA